MTDFKLKPLELKERNKYSKLVVFPPFMRQMLAWGKDVKFLDVTLKGSSVTLTPIPQNTLEAKWINQQIIHEKKVMVENDKKTVKLEKKKRA
jgi:hypothetical protein